MLALISDTGLAQSVERQPFKLVVEGSSPSFGEYFFMPLRIVVFEHFSIIEYPDQSALLDLAEPSHPYPINAKTVWAFLYTIKIFEVEKTKGKSLSPVFIDFTTSITDRGYGETYHGQID